MKIFFKAALIVLMCLGTVALFAYYISYHNVPVLDPKGWIGEKEKNLLSTASLLMLIVVIPVFILTLVFAWKYREGNTKSKHAPDWEHNYIAEYCWWGVPVIIIVILGFTTWKSSHDLNPFKPIETDKKQLPIQVVSLDWKWLFIYPEHGIATVNYVQFPEKTPLNFSITSDAPMNSFWIPQLGGQIYTMPGMRSKLYLIANEVGSFRGASANFSGKGFAGMSFIAKASSQQDFDEWVKTIKQSKKQLTWEEYNELVKQSENNPAEYYVLVQEDLFEKILMKYMAPATQ